MQWLSSMLLQLVQQQSYGVPRMTLHLRRTKSHKHTRAHTISTLAPRTPSDCKHPAPAPRCWYDPWSLHTEGEPSGNRACPRSVCGDRGSLGDRERGERIALPPNALLELGDDGDDAPTPAPAAPPLEPPPLPVPEVGERLDLPACPNGYQLAA